MCREEEINRKIVIYEDFKAGSLSLVIITKLLQVLKTKIQWSKFEDLISFPE